MARTKKRSRKNNDTFPPPDVSVVRRAAQHGHTYTVTQHPHATIYVFLGCAVGARMTGLQAPFSHNAALLLGDDDDDDDDCDVEDTVDFQWSIHASYDRQQCCEVARRFFLDHVQRLFESCREGEAAHPPTAERRGIIKSPYYHVDEDLQATSDSLHLLTQQQVLDGQGRAAGVFMSRVMNHHGEVVYRLPRDNHTPLCALGVGPAPREARDALYEFILCCSSSSSSSSSTVQLPPQILKIIGRKVLAEWRYSMLAGDVSTEKNNNDDDDDVIYVVYVRNVWPHYDFYLQQKLHVAFSEQRAIEVAKEVFATTLNRCWRGGFASCVDLQQQEAGCIGVGEQVTADNVHMLTAGVLRRNWEPEDGLGRMWTDGPIVCRVLRFPGSKLVYQLPRVRQVDME